MLIETDVLLAALNPADPLNRSGRALLDRSPMLSPFSLLEINLLSRARKLDISDYDAFATDLGALLTSCSVKILSDRTQYHALARRFESKHKLSFFDSLHAAVAKTEGEVLASFDRAYERLESDGVKRIDPPPL